MKAITLDVMAYKPGSIAVPNKMIIADRSPRSFIVNFYPP